MSLTTYEIETYKPIFPWEIWMKIVIMLTVTLFFKKFFRVEISITFRTKPLIYACLNFA